MGELANRPTTCATNSLEAGGGVGYWATDTNTLYRCSATNTWTAHYQPYTYPHPSQRGTTSTSDTTPPTVSLAAPADGASVSGSIAVSANASDNVGVAGVQFRLDGVNLAGEDTTSPYALTWDTTSATNGSHSLTAVARDAAGNRTTSAARTVTVGNATPPPPQGESTLWPSSATPAVITEQDPNAVELGVRVRPAVNGRILGIRFYKGPSNTGTHIGNLWNASGTRLATATFSSETASGWQQVRFATPVSVTAGKTYIASYHTNAGMYSYTRNYFASAYTNGNLTAPATTNGVYAYGASSVFPTKVWYATNYWVDVIFAPTQQIQGSTATSPAQSLAETVPTTRSLASRSATTAAAGKTGDGGSGKDARPKQAAATGDRLPILLPSAEAEAGSEWTYIDAASGFADAVVIAGTPSVNEDQPGVVRLSQVSGAGFELRFQEWDYLQRLGASAHAAEKIPYAVLQPGRYSMGDGSIWEVGTFPLDGGASWQRVPFSEPFASAPAVFLTVQTANDPRAVTARARGVTAEGFDAALLQEEAQREGHGAETVGYLAIRRDSAGGTIDAGGDSVPYILQSVAASDRWLPVLSQRLRLEEEQSKGAEVRHPDESIDVLAMGRHIFAQQVSDNSADPTTIRRLPPIEGAAMEWGLLRGIDSAWTVLPLAKRYTNPVVIARSVSSHDPAPGVVRLRQVAADRLELRFQEWTGAGPGHAKEDTFYMVAEAGRHALGDLQVEAGVAGGSSAGGDWQRVAFAGGFDDAPVVLSSVQTANGAKAASARIANVSGPSFLTALDLRPDEGGGSAGERIGWIAVEQGRNATVEGRQVRAFFDDVDGTLGPVRFPAATNHRHPTVVSDLNGSLDPTPVFLRHANPASSQIKLRIARQEVAGTAATWHQQEKAGLFVGE